MRQRRTRADPATIGRSRVSHPHFIIDHHDFEISFGLGACGTERVADGSLRVVRGQENGGGRLHGDVG